MGYWRHKVTLNEVLENPAPARARGGGGGGCVQEFRNHPPPNQIKREKEFISIQLEPPPSSWNSIVCKK